MHFGILCLLCSFGAASSQGLANFDLGSLISSFTTMFNKKGGIGGMLNDAPGLGGGGGGGLGGLGGGKGGLLDTDRLGGIISQILGNGASSKQSQSDAADPLPPSFLSRDRMADELDINTDDGEWFTVNDGEGEDDFFFLDSGEMDKSPEESRGYNSEENEPAQSEEEEPRNRRVNLVRRTVRPARHFRQTTTVGPRRRGKNVQESRRRKAAEAKRARQAKSRRRPATRRPRARPNTTRRPRARPTTERTTTKAAGSDGSSMDIFDSY